jgi:uncharacterized protein YecE (DUF72 family)
MQIFIGTSGWMYGGAWDRKFYPRLLPAKDKLAYYATQFPAAEVNASFYRLLKPETVKHWYTITPKNYIFTVKLHRYLTHNKKLRVDDKFMEMYEAFVEPLRQLKDKLGMVVVQLPANFGTDIEKLDNFVVATRSLESKYNISLPLAFEFRHYSWFNDEIFDFMHEHHLTNITSDSPNWPENCEVTSDTLYIRLHGHRLLYFSKYSKKSLEKWTHFIQSQNVKTAYIFFDNTARANAVINARQLRELNH